MYSKYALLNQAKFYADICGDLGSRNCTSDETCFLLEIYGSELSCQKSIHTQKVPGIQFVLDTNRFKVGLRVWLADFNVKFTGTSQKCFYNIISIIRL